MIAVYWVSNKKITSYQSPALTGYKNMQPWHGKW